MFYASFEPSLQSATCVIVVNDLATSTFAWQSLVALRRNRLAHFSQAAPTSSRNRSRKWAPCWNFDPAFGFNSLFNVYFNDALNSDLLWCYLLLMFRKGQIFSSRSSWTKGTQLNIVSITENIRLDNQKKKRKKLNWAERESPAGIFLFQRNFRLVASDRKFSRANKLVFPA